MKLARSGGFTTICGMALLIVIVLVSLDGCGGSGEGYSHIGNVNSTSAVGGGNAQARFVIKWPKAKPHYRPAIIPIGTNRIIIYVSGPNIPNGTVAYAKDRTGSSDLSAITIDVPAGPKTLFSAEARQVAQVSFSDVTPLSLNNPALEDGTRLGAGNDAQAHNINIGDKVDSTIAIVAAGTPDTGTTTVATTVNQVLATYFPTVIALQVIRDQNGQPITNMNAGNFDVSENGQPCVITDVRTVQQASSNLATALVLDRSDSMAGEKNAALEASASEFVSLLQPADMAEIINFSDNVEVTQPFTSDQGLLTKAIQGQFSRFDGNTSLFDGIFQGITDTAKQGGREAVIVLTDGRNNQGQYSSDDDVQAAKQNNIPIFTIGLGADADDQTLGDIAARTGGIYTVAPSASDLASIYQTISNQLNGQIQLSFISPDPTKSGTSRHVVVNINYGSLTAQSTYDYTM